MRKGLELVPRRENHWNSEATCPFTLPLHSGPSCNRVTWLTCVTPTTTTTAQDRLRAASLLNCSDAPFAAVNSSWMLASSGCLLILLYMIGPTQSDTGLNVSSQEYKVYIIHRSITVIITSPPPSYLLLSWCMYVQRTHKWRARTRFSTVCRTSDAVWLACWNVLRIALIVTGREICRSFCGVYSWFLALGYPFGPVCIMSSSTYYFAHKVSTRKEWWNAQGTASLIKVDAQMTFRTCSVNHYN